MTSRALLGIGLALCLAVAMPARPAVAQKSGDDAALKRAKRHHKQGEKLFALGRFDEALTSYEAAFESKPLPHFLFNIGQCHRNLGNFDQAIFSFRKYLKLWPDAPNRTAVLELIDELETEREEVREAERRRKLNLGGATPGPRPGKGAPKPRASSGGLHTKWWFWAGIATAAAVTTGGVILLSAEEDATLPNSDLGNVDFSR